MPKVSIDAWIPYVEGQVSNCPAEIMRQKIRDALAEFMAESRIYQVELTAFDIVANTNLYDLRPVTPDGFLVAKTPRAWYEGERMFSRGPETLEKLLGRDWRVGVSTRSRYFYRPTPQEVRLVYTPSVASTGAVVIEAVLKPDPDTQDIPGWIFEEYREGIAHGALAKIYAQLHTPWGSQNARDQEDDIFKIWIGRAAERGARKDTDEIPILDAVSFGNIIPRRLSAFEDQFDLE